MGGNVPSNPDWQTTFSLSRSVVLSAPGLKVSDHDTFYRRHSQAIGNLDRQTNAKLGFVQIVDTMFALFLGAFP
ncbi:hypothetical protein FEE96_12200 [Parasedimentitalea maritima]|uniref:Uncharacterized protein n=1 Tax=Parasedimentitalea maritima TaxID=2578117 RepID=A0ABY2UZ43_9RHOB|nr:hypothetical protein FEE96_12200 [Zongyanglinia marina]